MSEGFQHSASSGDISPSGLSDPKGGRYSLKEMMEEVAMERRESVFGRELVDTTEIEKMFSKKIRKKKKR